ncbi:hypothetical protein AAII07_28815 [Microvirga sp. 0TCS3.31]
MTPDEQAAINEDERVRRTARKVYTREQFDCPTCGVEAPLACRTASGARAETWHAERYNMARDSAGWPFPSW